MMTLATIFWMTAGTTEGMTVSSKVRMTARMTAGGEATVLVKSAALIAKAIAGTVTLEGTLEEM